MKKLLIDKKGKRQLVEEGKDLHTHYGVISQKDLEAIDYGGYVRSHTGAPFNIVSPTVVDFIEKMQKSAQIIYPKDSAIIIGLCGLRSGSRVVEAGTGVAGMTMMLANTVSPEGKIYTYEIREDHFKESKSHIEEADLMDCVTMHNKSVYDGIEEDDLDAVILDLPEPWMVSEDAYKKLKFGGHLVAYSPSIEQVKKFVTGLPQGFWQTETIEILLREWEVSEQRVRPKTRMVGHTGFVTITRKLGEQPTEEPITRKLGEQPTEEPAQKTSTKE